jgi:hypothetical protein
MSKISFISFLILFVAYSSTNGQSAHYFDKYIEGVFKSIESPPAECLKPLEESDESKMLANNDLLMCYTLIENGIPKQLKFDILSYRLKEKERAEAIKNKAIFGTCYRKDSSSKYYAQLFADLESKPNKSPEENEYIANINSHCTNLHSMHFETDYIMKETKAQKRQRRRATSGTIGVLVSTYVLVLIAILTYNLNFNM